MSDRTDPTLQQSLEDLSALSDGQIDAAGATRVAARWRECEETRRSWHAYHLIGDVLRSEDLADAARDEAFLQSLRGRLALEPVVLAPAASELNDQPSHIAPVAMAGGGATARRRRWGAPVAVAAGFMAVAGALMVTRVAEQPAGPEAALVATATGDTRHVKADAGPARVAAPEPILVVNGELVRDAQLDRYLSAHKQFGGNTALGVPSGFLRSATYEAPNR
jgi:sigma-E factor negative regulatory protein RseA